MRRFLLALAVVLAPAGARAAITYVGAVGSAEDAANNTSNLSVTGVTTTNANALLVAVVQGTTQNGTDTQGVTSISGGGLTWSLARRQHNGWTIWSEIWYAPTISTLSNQTITVNLTGNNQDNKFAAILELTGAAASPVGNTAAQARTNTGNYQLSVGSVSSGSLVIGAFNTQWNGNTLTNVTGYTQDSAAPSTGRERAGHGSNALVGYTDAATNNWTAVAVEILAGAGGPQTYSDSFSEAATAGESLSTSATWPNSASEGATAGDSAVAGNVSGVTVSEAASTGDSLTNSATWPNVMSEPVSPGDTVPALATWPNAIAESVTSGETLSDSQSNGAQTYSDSISEPASASDSIGSTATWASSVNEASSPNDALGNSASWLSSASEQATAGDSTSSSVSWVSAASEPASPSDSLADELASGATYSDSIVEALSATDGLTAALVFASTITEPVSANSGECPDGGGTLRRGGSLRGTP